MSPDETTLYEAVVASPAAPEPLRRYRDWLAQRSDARAHVVAGLLAALQGDASLLVPSATPWATALGLPLAEALAAEDQLAALPALLASTRMGLEMRVGGPPTGRTRFFGDPELPAALKWPTHGDCTMWDPIPEVAADLPCRFVCQLDLAELRGPGVPVLEGLLSVFVFQEYDEYGSAGVVLHHFAADAVLETRTHPDCDEANDRLEPEGVKLRTVRMLPARDGPWQALAEAHEEAWEIGWEALSSHTYGVFGHLRGTTGDDPTPSATHQRLLVGPCDDEGVLNVHLAIDQEALAAGRVDAFELAWVDFDGL